LTRTTARSLRLGFAAVIAFALTLSAGSRGASAQEAKEPLPPNVTVCDFPALANDHTREGLNIRAEPRTDSAILGRLPIIENANHEKIAADVHVIGVKNGWFLIEGAFYGDYDLPEKLPPVYAGRGWVSGRLLTTELQTDSLKTAPGKNAPDVVEASWFDATAILDCKGDWLRIEVPLSTKDRTLKPKLPSDDPANIVRGWAWGRLSCTQQRTTCDFGGVLPPPPPILEIWRNDANTQCLPLPDERSAACTVEQFGELGSVDDTTFYYAMYHYADPQNRVLDYQRAVILKNVGGGHLDQLFATPGEPAIHYDEPRLIKLADRTLLLIPGHESGTGNFNREQMFVRRDYNWGKADTASWLDDLGHRLPAGLAVWKGVYPDYTTMTAETPLWRNNDSNACPTGGRAKIILGWRADRIVLRSVRVERAGECGEPLP
jgi:hypothetical protein